MPDRYPPPKKKEARQKGKEDKATTKARQERMEEVKEVLAN